MTLPGRVAAVVEDLQHVAGLRPRAVCVLERVETLREVVLRLRLAGPEQPWGVGRVVDPEAAVLGHEHRGAVVPTRGDE